MKQKVDSTCAFPQFLKFPVFKIKINLTASYRHICTKLSNLFLIFFIVNNRTKVFCIEQRHWNSRRNSLYIKINNYFVVYNNNSRPTPPMFLA